LGISEPDSKSILREGTIVSLFAIQFWCEWNEFEENVLNQKSQKVAERNFERAFVNAGHVPEP